MISSHDDNTNTIDTDCTQNNMKAQTRILNEQTYPITQDKIMIKQEKLEDIHENNDNTQEKTASGQEIVFTSQGSNVNNVAFLSVEQIKQEQDESIQVKVEYDHEPENECKETLIKSEYKKLYEHHIVKDELVIGPEVKQEPCTNIDCVPKDETEYDQCMSKDDKNKTKSGIPCRFCNKVLSSRSNRDKHIKYHCSKNKHKIKPKATCSLCNKVYSSNKSVDTHIKYFCSMNQNTIPISNGQTETATCNLCSKVFSNKKTRNRHIRFHCVNENKTIKIKEVCNLCKKEFHKNQYLKQHIKYHCPMNQNKARNSESVVCHLCKKIFYEKKYLKHHIQHVCLMNQHRTPKPQSCRIEPTSCDLCNKVFTSKGSRDSHLRRYCPNNPNKSLQPTRNKYIREKYVKLENFAT